MPPSRHAVEKLPRLEFADDPEHPGFYELAPEPNGRFLNRDAVLALFSNQEGEQYAKFKDEFWAALRPMISETGKVGASTLALALDLAEAAALSPEEQS